MPVNTYLSETERLLLESATVGIAGAGGLGSNCAAHLVRAGVRRLVIADFDTVSASNLNRQFFFRDQIGRKKIDALRENLLRIEENLELEMHDVKVDAGNIHRIFDRCSILVEAFDHVESKQLLLREFLPTGKPIVSASGIAGWGGSGTIKLRKVGKNLILIGDLSRAAESSGESIPVSPRVGIVSAMQANTVAAMILNRNL